jgi:hypothetical protein
LFARSDAGGERAAAIYSLLGQINRPGSEHFLRYVLARIAEHPISASMTSCRGTRLPTGS